MTDLDWADRASCTLPNPERPLRMAEFDDLFAAHLVSVEADGVHALLVLRGKRALGDRVRALAANESECCSFFTFAVEGQGDHVHLGITVPPAYVDVLAALVRRAAERVPT